MSAKRVDISCSLLSKLRVFKPEEIRWREYAPELLNRHTVVGVNWIIGKLQRKEENAEKRGDEMFPNEILF